MKVTWEGTSFRISIAYNSVTPTCITCLQRDVRISVSQSLHTVKVIIDIIYSPALKSGGYTGFALSFIHSVILSFRHYVTLSLCHSVISSFRHNSDETWISLRPVGQSWSKFIWSIIRIGERLHKVLDQNSGFHANRKGPLSYNGENDISTFSLLLFIRSFSNLHVTRTSTKSWMSSNFGQIGPLATELDALERLKNFP